ncbi:MAG: HAMP domain-containing sensor histidine kinase [Acidimicrobiales bacterium]
MADSTPTWRFGLRRRITLAFGLGALLLSIILSVLTYSLTRDNLVSRREETALVRVGNNAVRVNAQLRGDTPLETARALVESLNTAGGSLPVLRISDQWIPANPVEFTQAEIDPQLLTLVVDQSTPAQMRYRQREAPFLVIGVPLPDPNLDADYFEAVPLDDIEETLDSMLLALLAGAAVTTLAGFALGTWSGRRALLPLSDISEAAESIAAGDLSTRLSAEDDIDLERLSASFNHMAEALENRIERDARFASEVSHELRSPLMTLTASVEILQSRRDEMPERSRTALDLLSSDITRFSQLVEDLLEISRYDVGTARLHAEPLQLDEVVRFAVDASGHHDVGVMTSVGAENLVVLGEKRRLAQVMTNLLDNADKYGGGATAVHISRNGPSATIAVTDEGPGVPAEEREIIFDRFSRGREGGRRGMGTGSGLGLALVAEHVRLHGGTVRVDDRVDGLPGARFVVELPIHGGSE